MNMSQSFSKRESACEMHFGLLPTVYHCVSPENYELIFTNEAEYSDAMLIVGVCSQFFAAMRILTFQLMSNHFHFVLSGDKSEVEEFISLFKGRLLKYFAHKGRSLDNGQLAFKLYPVGDLDYCRATIAYCNRNGFVVNDNVTPFSYPWGANCCYFNPMLERQYECSKRLTKVTDIRSVYRGKSSDIVKSLYLLGHVVSPFSFCDYSAGEKMFRDAKHYFYSVSKNVEAYHRVASIISESIAYTDDDLYFVTRKISKEKYSESNPALLSGQNKIELAKLLHYEYNAGDKQILRLLKLDPNILAAMF